MRRIDAPTNWAAAAEHECGRPGRGKPDTGQIVLAVDQLNRGSDLLEDNCREG
jgi:hypothetical protein